jgi:hypothetical protein
MLFRSVLILDIVTVVCFLVQNIVVYFEYQKHVHFRNGYIVIGDVLSFFFGEAKCDMLPAKCVKASGFVFIL